MGDRLQGPIQDRSREHLGQSDRGIALYRRLLLDAIDQAEKGERPLMVLTQDEAKALRGPATLDGIGPTADWQRYWQEADRKRRTGASWAASAAA